MQMDLGVGMTTTDTRKQLRGKALLDSGCTISSIDASFVRINGLTTKPAAVVTPVYNADMTINGYIKEYVELEIEVKDADGSTHRERFDFQVVNLGGKHDIFIGYDWLYMHNPLVDWRDKELVFGRCPEECHLVKGPKIETMGEYIRT